MDQALVTLGAVALGAVLSFVAASLDRRRSGHAEEKAAVKSAISEFIVAAMSITYVQQLLVGRPMQRHLRWRPTAIDTYLQRTDGKLERLLAAKTALDLATDDEELGECADALMSAVIAVGDATHAAAEDSAVETLKGARLAFLSHGRRVIDSSNGT
jgi:hypothetical protein